MSFPALHRPHAIVFPDPTGGGNPVIVTQFQSLSVNRQWAIYRQKASSAAGPQFSGIEEADPESQFSCLDLKSVLDLVTSAKGQQGLVVGYDPVVNTGTVKVYYRKGKKRGLREAIADAVHDRFDLVSNAMFFWRSISAQQGRNNRASIDCTLKAISNDGANPFVHAGSSVCEGTEAVTYLYGIGPVKINTVLVPSVASVRVDNGITAGVQYSDGAPYPQYAEVDDANATTTVETSDVNVMDTYEEPVAISTLVIYLRRLAKNGLPYADNSAVHIKLTATAGMVVASESSGNPGKFNLQLAVDKPSDSAGPWAINTACAIT